eukprot:tig00021589_g22738.t1
MDSTAQSVRSDALAKSSPHLAGTLNMTGTLSASTTLRQTFTIGKDYDAAFFKERSLRGTDPGSMLSAPYHAPRAGYRGLAQIPNPYESLPCTYAGTKWNLMDSEDVRPGFVASHHSIPWHKTMTQQMREFTNDDTKPL